MVSIVQWPRTSPCGGENAGSNPAGYPKMSFHKKLAVFDLDGTLTESKQPLDKEMAFLLLELSKKTMVAVISGASYEQFRAQFLSHFTSPELAGNNLILLPTSGSQCYEFDDPTGDWKLVDEIPFAPADKEKVLTVLREIISSGQFDIPTESQGDYIEDRGTQITFSALGQRATQESKQAWDPDKVKRQKIKTEIDRQVPGLSISFGGMSSVDILPAGQNKATGLKRFLARIKLPIADVVFVGDSLFAGGNDLSVKETGIETLAVSGPAETKALISDWLT